MTPQPRDPERILTRLEWTVIRRLDGILQGDYRTLFQGFGLDLADLREYQYGDDVRCIDWNVTARMGTPHVRRYLEDREITAWFLLDMSPSVDFGTVRVRKRDLLVAFTAVLARLLTRHGNRVGAMVYDGVQVRRIPAGGGRRQVLRMLHEIEASRRLERSPATDLSLLFSRAYAAIPRRSLLFVVSDFWSAPGWGPALGMLNRRHETLAVLLTDPRERELPDIGPVVLQDAETGEQVLVDTHSRAFRKRFADAAMRRDELLGSELRRLGVDALELSTEEDMVDSVVRFAARRRKRKHTPAAFSTGRVAAGAGGAA